MSKVVTCLIRESSHFYFNGRKSTDFGIQNVAIVDGFYSEQVMPDRQINEVQIRGRYKPYFVDVVEEPKTLQLRFAFMYSWNEKLINDVLRWLNVSYYRRLYFEEGLDNVYYAMPVDNVRKIHNGLKQGYLELNMRCDSGRSYSHDIIKTYNTKELSEWRGVKEPEIVIGNKGHYDMYPKIWIEKIDKGDISIRNRSDNNRLFEFKDIEIGEKLYVDCEEEFIQTNLERTYRYDNFNDKYLVLPYGENRLLLSPNMKIKFKYNYMFVR